MSDTLGRKDKQTIIKQYKIHQTDTGSPEVQIALSSEKIKNLLSHLKNHPKDLDSKRGLLKAVVKRKKMLNYLRQESIRRYNSILKKIK